MHHLTSYLAHGVFDKFPSLRIAMLESGTVPSSDIPSALCRAEANELPIAIHVGNTFTEVGLEMTPLPRSSGMFSNAVVLRAGLSVAEGVLTVEPAGYTLAFDADEFQARQPLDATRGYIASPRCGAR